ncbi:MAG TPA: hypothetical protein VFP31_04465 [Gaiellaceae bacterium]|nr:hypothetical protein [Gaiellaceae bacterium]
MTKALKKLIGFAIFAAVATAGMAGSAMLALQLTGSSEADARPAPAAPAQLVSFKKARAPHPYNLPCQNAKTEADLLLVSEDLSTVQGIQRAARGSIGINVRLLVALRRTHKQGTLEGRFLSRLEASIKDDQKNVGLLRPGADRRKLREWLIRNDRVNAQLRGLAGRFHAPECVAYFGM